MAPTSVARRIGKRAMAHGVGSVGLYTAVTPALPRSTAPNFQARSLQRSTVALWRFKDGMQPAPLGQREKLEEVHNMITMIARDHILHSRKPYYALMNLTYEKLAASPSEKYDTAIRIWKALEHRARNLAQPRIDILPEMHLALLRVHVATSHDVDLPTVAREMARYKVNETEDFLIMKARCAAQIGDVQATNKLTERLVKEHGYHPQDSKLTSPTLTAYLNNADFHGAFAKLKLAAPSENDVPRPRPRLSSFVQILHHCGRTGNVRMVDQVIEAMRDCGYVDGFTLRFFNNLVVAYALAGRMDGMTEAMRVRQRAGLSVEPKAEAAFYRACLSGDFEEAAEIGTKFLEAGKHANKTTIIALLQAYAIRGDSDRGLELLLFLDSLGWRHHSVQPRQIWLAALELFISTGDHDSAVKLIKFLIADYPEHYDHYMITLAQRCIAHSVVDQDVTFKGYQVAVAQRAESFMELDGILEENTIQRRAYLQDTGGIEASENARMYSRHIWESKVSAMTKLKAPKDARTSLQLVDHQIQLMKRQRWLPMDAAIAARMNAVTNDIRFARFSDDPEKVLAVAMQDAEDVMAKAYSFIESNRALGKSVMPAVATAVIELELERKPLKAVLKELERLQRVWGLHSTNAGPYEAILDYLARHGRVDDSIAVLNTMESEKLYLQPKHFRGVFRLCCERGDEKRATDAYIMVRANDVSVTQETVEFLLETYCKAGDRGAALGLMKGVGYYDPMSEQTYAKLLFNCLEAFGDETMIQMYDELQKATDVIQFTPKEIQASASHDDTAEDTYSDEDGADDVFAEDGIDDVYTENGEHDTDDEVLVEIAPEFVDAAPETVGAGEMSRQRKLKVKAAEAQLKSNKRLVYKQLQAVPKEGPFTLYVFAIPTSLTRKRIADAFDAAFKDIGRKDEKFKLLSFKAKTEQHAFIKLESRDDLVLALVTSAKFENGKNILTKVGTPQEKKTQNETRRSQRDTFASSIVHLRSALKKLSGQDPVALEVTDALDTYEEAEAVDLQEITRLLGKYYQDVPAEMWQHVVAAYLSPGPVNYIQKVKSTDMEVFETNTIPLTDKILLQFLDVVENKTSTKHTARSAEATAAELTRLMKRLLDVWKPGPKSTPATVAIYDYYSASSNHIKAKEYFGMLTDSRGPHVLHNHARKRIMVNLLLLLANQRDFKSMSKILDENLQMLNGLDDATTLQLANVLLRTLHDDGRTLAKALFNHCVKRKTGVGQPFSEKLRLIEYYAGTRNATEARKVYDLIEAEGQVVGEWANLFLIRAYAKQGSFAAMEEAEVIMANLQTSVAARSAESKHNASYRESLIDKLTLGREIMIQGYSHTLTSSGSDGPDAQVFVRLKDFLAEVAQTKHRSPKRETLVALSTALAHDSVNRADLFVALYQNVTRASDAARMLKAYMQQSLFQNAKPDVQRVIAAMDARDELDGANFEFLLTFIQRGKSAEKKKQAFKSLFALMYKLPKSRNLQKTLVNAHILKMEHICDGQDELKATLLDLKNAVDQSTIIHHDRRKIAKIFADAGLENPGLQ